MDVMIKLTVPNYIYRFYRDASLYVSGSSPEDIMSDALCAYAGLLNQDVAKLQKSPELQDENPKESSEISRSR